MFKSLVQNWKRNTLSLGMAFVMLGVVVFSAPTQAQAATVAQLQAQITALLAQIAILQGGSSMSCYNFTRDLTVGSQGTDVTALQNYLASKGYFNVAATGYFGPITASAASAWQSANGVMPPAGYFGPISRAKYNSTCAPVVVPTPTPTPGDDNDFNSGNGNEASLEDFDVRDGDDTNLEEQSSNQEIMEIRFDVGDADVEVQRIDVTFEFIGTNDGEEDPWRVFESAALFLDGDRVAEVDDLDDEDTWNERGTDTYSIRFNRINEVIREGDRAEFILKVDVGNGVDGVTVGGANSWNVYIDDNGIRALDEAGIDQYTGDDTDVVEIDIEEAGIDDELSLREAEDGVDATVLEVDDGAKSKWHTLAVMELSAEGDIELKDFIFELLVNKDEANDETYNDIISDLVLIIDGEEYDDFSVSDANTATATITFDLSDEDVVIDDGDDVDVEVRAEFKGLDGNYDEGTTVTVNTSAGLFDMVDAEGVDSGEDLEANQLDGSYEGETHTLRHEGISLVLVDTSAVAPVGSDEAQANYKIEFKVTAFGSDWFIEKSASRDADGVADNDDGVDFIIEDGSGTLYATTAASVVASLSKSGSNSGDTSTHYKISEGQTRTFTLQVVLDNDGADSGYYRAHIIGIGFDSDGTGGTSSDLLSTGLDNFDTRVVFVSGTDANN